MTSVPILDELATLLLQAESEDDAVVEELRRALDAAIPECTEDFNVTRCLVQAAETLEPTPRPPGALAKVQALLDAAMHGRAPESLSPRPAVSPPRAASDGDRSLLADFVIESREYLESAEAALLELEADPGNAEAINTIFRAFHTVKGTSGFLNLPPVTDLAHCAESMLSAIRDGSVACTPERASVIFQSIDVLNALLDQAAPCGTGSRAEPPPGYAEIVDRLRALEANGYQVDAGTPAPTRAARAERAERAGTASSVPGPSTAALADAMVRVRTDRLDRLIDMVGELVIAQSMVTQDACVRGPGNELLGRKVAHAGKIVRELQDLSMAMRMVPLKGAFQKVARLARDLGQKSGKLVDFASEGEDTEIDRNLVDMLADPLVHLVRNSVDHGLEASDERVAAGKSPQGHLRLTAYHGGGNVIVELTDDGRGLNRERILAKARERGLIGAAELPSESAIDRLIFLPGFSTAEKVTDISGRGVGMDVVQRNVEAMRGRIDITSAPGRGTTVSIRLPLTLAITDGMLVRVGDERYLVPTLQIRLSFRPEPAQLATIAGLGEIVLLRGEPIPILRLNQLFGIDGAVERPCDGLLMVVGDSRTATALLVDGLLGQHQVVAKSLGQALGRVPAFAGGAVLGDGRIGLILDVNELGAIARRSTPAATAEAMRAVA